MPSPPDAAILLDRARSTDLRDQTAVRDTRQHLGDAARDTEGRATLAALLIRPEASDGVRLLILDVLNHHADERDVAAILRATVGNRPVVVSASLPLLATLGTAEVQFALQRIFAVRNDASGALARSLADGVAAALPGPDALRAAADGADRALGGVAAGEWALAAMVVEPQVLVRVRCTALTEWKLRLEEELVELDAEVRRRNRDVRGGWPEYDTVLRDAIYEATLLTGVPGEGDLHRRAVEHLFRREDLDAVARLAPDLPEATLAEYVERALAPTHRRGPRRDRALLALQHYARLAEGARARTRMLLLDTLEDEDESVRATALELLAGEEHGSELSDRLFDSYKTLSPDAQTRVSPALANLRVPDAETALDGPAFARWVAGATGDDREARLATLFREWTTGAVDPAEAGALLAAYEAAAGDDRAEWDASLADAIAVWLKERGGRIVEAIRALSEWPPFGAFALANVGRVLNGLRADPARAALRVLIAEHGETAVAVIADSDVPAERVLIPVLVAALAADPAVGDAAFLRVTDVGRRRLLAAGLAVLGDARRASGALAASEDADALLALESRRDAVLQAIGDARAAGEGNDALLLHLGLLRDAVSSAGVSVVAEPSAVVRAWRVKTTQRLGGLIAAPESGGQPLTVTGGVVSQAGELMKLLVELDHRANSARVVAAGDRVHAAADLVSVVTAVAEAGLVERLADELPASRMSLAQAMWRAWAATHRGDTEIVVAGAFGDAADADASGRRGVTMRIDALAPQLDSSGAVRAVAAVAADALDGAWQALRPALQHAVRERAAREASAKSQTAGAMEELAERLDAPLRAIESMMVSYFRLRELLDEAGWEPVESGLGRHLTAAQLDPEKHEIVGAADVDEFLVRSLGIRIKDRIVRRAVVEGIVDGQGGRSHMIGLDFGTTNSCAAFSDVYGIVAAAVEPDQEVPYHTVLRTAVLDPEGEAPMLGAPAIRASGMPRQKKPCLISFKPMLDEMQLKTLVREEVRAGRYFHQMSQSELDRYEYRDVWKGGRYSRAELLGSTRLILERLLATAIAEGGEDDLLWLGLPVTFSGIARKRLVAALADARDADGRRIFSDYRDVLRRTRFVLEPVAVASLPMQEAIDVADRETVLVFDHGGGTLDLSLIDFARLPDFEHPMPVRELAARGSDTVAGRSIDMAFRSGLANSSAFRDAVSGLRDHTVDGLIEAAKIRLSTSDGVEVFGGVRLGRDDFECAIAPVLDDIDTLVRATVASAGLEVGDVDRVVMTGGSSLIPAVQAHVGSLFSHLDEYHLLTYDPSSKDDVERAVTEVARGLVAFGTQVAESGVFEQVVLWDMSMSLAPQRGMSVLIPRGTPYHRNGDGTLKLTVNAPLPARPGEGSSVGLYEDQLDQRFVFGLCDMPPVPPGARMEITLRPEQLAPCMRLIGPDGNPVAPEASSKAWATLAAVEADLMGADEKLLCAYFDEDAEYLPVAGYKHFESTPLVRKLRVGDLVEWARDADGEGPRRSIVRRRGVLRRIRHIGSGEFVDEMRTWCLEEHVFDLVDEGKAVINGLKGRTGSLRLSPRPWKDF